MMYKAQLFVHEQRSLIVHMCGNTYCVHFWKVTFDPFKYEFGEILSQFQSTIFWVDSESLHQDNLIVVS